MDLLFLTDVSQVEGLTEELRVLMTRSTIVAADMATAARLEELGVPFVDLWEHLNTGDLHAHWLGAWNLVERWYEEGMSCTPHAAFPMAEIAKTEFYWPFELCLNARLMYERLLDSLPVRRIYCHFLPSISVIQSGPHPWERAATSLSHAVLRWCAARRGLPVHRLPLTRPLSNAMGPLNYVAAPEALTPPMPPGCEPPLYVHLLAGLPGHPVWQNEDRHRAASRPGIRTALVMDFLAAQEAVGLQNLFSRTPGWRVVRVGHVVADPGIGSWPWHEAPLTKPVRDAKRAFDDARSIYRGAHPELFANPFLRFQIDRIWAEMSKAVRLGESFRCVLKTVGASVVLFGYDSFVVERLFMKIARREGIPTAALLHGGLGHAVGSHDFIGDADFKIVVGRKDLESLSAYGGNRDNIRAVGSLRWNRPDKPQPGPTADQKVEARRRLGVAGEGPTALLMTSTIMGMSSPIARPSGHRETWRQIVRLARSRPDWTFLLKPHPGWDSYEFYRLLARNGPANFHFLWGTSLEDVLTVSDAAILVNYCTTAALEAMLRGVPVVFLQGDIYPRQVAQNSLDSGGAILANDVAALETALDRLTRDQAYRRKALEEADTFLASFFDGDEGTVQERMLRECERFAVPPCGEGSAGPIEAQIHQRLVTATALVARDDGRPAFHTAWADLIGVLASAQVPRDEIRRVLFCVSYDIGQSISDFAELQDLITRCYQTARRPLTLRAGEKRNMLINAIMASAGRCLHAGDGVRAATLLHQLLRAVPQATKCLARSPIQARVLASVLENMRTKEAELHKERVDIQSLRSELEALKADRDRLAVGASSLQQDRLVLQHDLLSHQRVLIDLRSSWTWKMGRFLVAPGSLLKRVIRKETRREG